MSQKFDPQQPERASVRSGFTLVELLVVIGIIALLISILLPSLSKAREAGLRTACAAKLKQMAFAAQLHASDHQGYYPLLGQVPGSMPSELDDTYSTKYDYFNGTSDGQPQLLANVTFALSLEMSHKKVLDSGNNAILGPEETDPGGLIKNFLCPSHATAVDTIKYQPLQFTTGDGWCYFEQQSYNWNELVSGWGPVAFPVAGSSNDFGRLQGKASRIRQAASTMYACDGYMNSTASNGRTSYSGWYMASIYNCNPLSRPPYTAICTLADAIQGLGLAGDPSNFDYNRHKGKINVAFCDGHVETLNLPPRNVNLATNSTTVTNALSGLRKVFLLAP